MIYNVDDVIGYGKTWPPEDKDESARLAEHTRNRKLYSDLHEEVLTKYNNYLNDGLNDDKKLKIILGWASLATDNYMSLLLGEGVKVDAPAQYDTPDEEVFIDASRYGVGLYEVSQDAITVLNPERVYFVVDPHNIRKVNSYVIFSDFTAGDKTCIKFTIHSKGQIQHLVYEYASGKLGILRPLADFPQFSDLADYPDGIQKTGIDECLVVRIDNALSSDRYYGKSDYSPSVYSLIETLDTAFARRAEVLAKFARPIPMVPESAMQFDHTRQKWVFKTEQAIILRENDKAAAYLTWGAELGAVEREIEQTMTQLLAMLKLSRVLIAGENEGQAESGTALRLRLIPTLAKVSKFATALKAALPSVYSLKSKLDSVLSVPGAGTAFEPDKVVVTLEDGIPEDPAETAQINLVRAQIIGTLKAQGVLDGATSLRAAIISKIIPAEALAAMDDSETEALVTAAAGRLQTENGTNF
ncbi:MAG: phage portal protein [Mesotoga sp.]|nr:phage portal protein [Mesotoga sp.]